MGFGNLLLGWALSLPAFVGIVWIGQGVRGQRMGNPLEALLGIGVLLLVPSVIFGLAAGWPVLHLLASLQPAWVIPLAAGAVLSSIMWGLGRVFLRSGWAGFEHTLVAYAAVFGVVLGSLVAFTG